MIVTMGKADPVGDVNPLLLNVLVPFMTEVVTSNPVGRIENLSWYVLIHIYARIHIHTYTQTHTHTHTHVLIHTYSFS